MYPGLQPYVSQAATLCILKEPGVRRRARPTVNQLPFCVGYHDPGIVAANQRRGIHVQAWVAAWDT